MSERELAVIIIPRLLAEAAGMAQLVQLIESMPDPGRIRSLQQE
jgi:hypothetical protein